jgi:5-dehydro-2-deoxygluconokinase
MGRSCIDLYAHQIGVPITEVTSFDAYVGGCPTNISVGTRRLGLRSVLLTAVGDDQVADFVLAFLDREAVETRFIPRKVGRRTSAVIMAIQPPDRFPLTFYRDGCADRELTIGDVDRAPIADSAIVLVTGTGLSHEPGRSATYHAAKQAQTSGSQLFVDVDYRPDQWPSRSMFAESMQELLRNATLAIGTEEEITAAANEDDVERAIAHLSKMMAAPIVLKRGARGATLFRDGSRVDIPPFKIEVLNVLGAGDAFASGLITGIRRGWPLERAIRMGNATGAIVVTRHGCANFMPTDGEVEAFVREQGGW